MLYNQGRCLSTLIKSPPPLRKGFVLRIQRGRKEQSTSQRLPQFCLIQYGVRGIFSGETLAWVKLSVSEQKPWSSSNQRRVVSLVACIGVIRGAILALTTPHYLFPFLPIRTPSTSSFQFKIQYFAYLPHDDFINNCSYQKLFSKDIAL
ncbi:hypothetical protein EV368DRAFT_67469 [Lentinula lateritia]|nr:hypothetical protein EV368DRAFT_67469 [Lentinula lateritia]